MATKLVTFKNKAGDVYHPQTTATQVKRGASSTVDADLTAVEALAGAAIPATQKGTANGVAPLGSDGKVSTTYLPPSALTVADTSVANIAALTALSATDAPLNSDVFVNDATGDTTVKSGWALYRRTATAGGVLTDWTKLSEGEGLDVAMVDQTARDAASSAASAAATAQGDVENLETVVEGLGTVYVINSGGDTSAVGDNDLIVEITGTV
jgi:hypothetical protein